MHEATDPPPEDALSGVEDEAGGRISIGFIVDVFLAVGHGQLTRVVDTQGRVVIVVPQVESVAVIDGSRRIVDGVVLSIVSHLHGLCLSDVGLAPVPETVLGPVINHRVPLGKQVPVQRAGSDKPVSELTDELCISGCNHPFIHVSPDLLGQLLLGLDLFTGDSFTVLRSHVISELKAVIPCIIKGLSLEVPVVFPLCPGDGIDHFYTKFRVECNPVIIRHVDAGLEPAVRQRVVGYFNDKFSKICRVRYTGVVGLLGIADVADAIEVPSGILEFTVGRKIRVVLSYEDHAVLEFHGVLFPGILFLSGCLVRDIVVVPLLKQRIVGVFRGCNIDLDVEPVVGN